MRLATVRTGGSTAAVRIDGDEAVTLPAPDVGSLLAVAGWRQVAADADGPRQPVAGLDFAPLVPNPGKFVCVGLNYRSHIAEMGRELPPHPTLFAKFADALIGAHDPIVLPPESAQVDWEAELGVVVGAEARRVPAGRALDVIAGYTIVNDVSVRDWQKRTLEWLQGKTWERTTPVGPYLVTPDESPGPSRAIRCEVDGDEVQSANTDDLVFDPCTLVSYVSTIVTLRPGDVIATGTPGGVGVGRTPPRFLRDGDVVVTSIEGLGECRNRCVGEQVDAVHR